MRRWGLLILLGTVMTGISGCFLFTPPVVGPQLLFSDDFSNASSPGWWQGTYLSAEWDIAGGRYYGAVDDADSYDYVYNDAVGGWTDFSVEATTGQLGLAGDHSWGLILRAQDEAFYAFEISTDGYVLFSVSTPTDWFTTKISIEASSAWPVLWRDPERND